MLVNLPLRNLLLAQRICRRIHDITQNSSPLQTQLYFRTATGIKSEQWVLTDDDRLLVGATAANHLSKSEVSEYTPFKPAVLNPLILENMCRDDIRRFIYFGIKNRNLDKYHLRLEGSIYRPESNCRSMLLSQPLVCAVVVDLYKKRYWQQTYGRIVQTGWDMLDLGPVTIPNPRGIALDDLLREAAAV